MVAGHLQQKKGYWYMVLNLHDQAGRRKTKWIATHLPVPGNRKRAEELLFQTRHQYADSKGESGLLFADYMLQWLGIMKAKVSPTTYTGYRNLVENSICPYFWERRITLAGLRASDVQRYYDDLLASGVSGNTILHHHANIHKALKDAVRLDLVDRNVADIVERPKKVPYIPRYYSLEEANELLDKLRGHWLWLPVMLCLFYGLRRSEVLGIRWSAIDDEKGTLSINHKVTEGMVDGRHQIYTEDKLKTKSSFRTLPLIPAVRALLDEQRARQEEYRRLFKKSYCTEYLDYVCTDEMGRLFRPNYITDHFKLLLKQHGLRHIRFHDLRHSCASLLLSQGIPMKQIQEWLGHSTFATTADIYSHLDFNSKLESAQAISDAFAAEPESALAL